MKIIRADAMGMCFGVRDALTLAASVERPTDVTIHGELVHNQVVLVQLEGRGFRQTSEQHRRGIPETPEVLITAHGISKAERQRLEVAGKHLIDTTCPLVRRVHEAAQDLAANGYHVLIIGQPNHVEVRGIVEDLQEYDILSSLDDVRRWPHARLGIVCQSTTPPALAAQIAQRVKTVNPGKTICFRNTVCQPTRDRQQAVETLCDSVDVVVVVGGYNSNNTRQLVELCRERQTPAFHVQTADDLDPAWFDGHGIVGLTAGTSTLDETIQAVYEALAALGKD